MSDGRYVGAGFAFFVVLFILLIIVGCSCMTGGFGGYGPGFGFW
jgi:uncharacterized protein (TIGR01732 family)